METTDGKSEALIWSTPEEAERHVALKLQADNLRVDNRVIKAQSLVKVDIAEEIDVNLYQIGIANSHLQCTDNANARRGWSLYEQTKLARHHGFEADLTEHTQEELLFLLREELLHGCLHLREMIHHIVNKEDAAEYTAAHSVANGVGVIHSVQTQTSAYTVQRESHTQRYSGAERGGY